MHLGSMCIRILRTWQLVETLGVAQIVYAEVKEQRGESFAFYIRENTRIRAVEFLLVSDIKELISLDSKHPGIWKNL